MRPVRCIVQLCGGVVLAGAALVAPAVQAGDLDALLDEYRRQGAGEFSAEAGEALWNKDFGGESCTACHSGSPRDKGRHNRTGKVIEPMAPSVNPERLTALRQMKKWLLRNCKSTLGRECTAQEKGDVLTWLRDR